ncbi:MAG: efflux RND transporter periplasmic adaptor subunit [Hylemonella sp.]|nr:efflux RND transporter periplasmic adaptor subunit [Hylemonella sp.]
MKRMTSWVLVLGLAGSFVPVQAHEGHDHGNEAPAGVAAVLARLPDGSVNIPKTAQRRMAIRTTLAGMSDAAATLQLPARVVMDPNRSGRVQAVYGGRVEPGPRGLPVAGQAVKRGEVLAYVRYQAEPYAVANQQSQLSELRAQRQIAEQKLQRLESLEGTVPRKDIDAARTDLAGLREREGSVGASLGQREALTAPVSGVIASVALVAGQVVQARDVLFEVVDPAHMLVEAGTPDATLGTRIAGAQLADVPGTRLKLLGAARALRDGLLPLTFSVQAGKPGAALPLAIGQPVQLIVQLKERVQGIVLPAQAVVRNPANEPIVWIKTSAERYMPQPVQYRALDAQTVVVTQGLGADKRVVVQGAPLIAQIR